MKGYLGILKTNNSENCYQLKNFCFNLLKRIDRNKDYST